jgi:hypothetical protein
MKGQGSMGVQLHTLLTLTVYRGQHGNPRKEIHWTGGCLNAVAMKNIFCSYSIGNASNFNLSELVAEFLTARTSRHLFGCYKNAITLCHKSLILYPVYTHTTNSIISTIIMSWFYVVTIDGVWTGNWIQWPLTDRNYKIQDTIALTLIHTLSRSLKHVLSLLCLLYLHQSLSGNGFQYHRSLNFRAHGFKSSLTGF